MTTLLQSFEGVTPSGTTVTTGNSGVGTDTAFDAVTIGGSSTFASSNAQAAHGSLSATVTGAATESAYGQWSTAMGTTTSLWGRMYCYFASLPTGTVRLFAALNTASSASAAVQMGTNGKLSVLDSSSATVQTGPTVIATAQWIRIEWAMVFSATAGSVQIQYYSSQDSSSVDQTITTTALNTNSQATLYRFGRAASATAATGAFFIDDLNLNDTGYPGPLTAPPAGGGASIQIATIRRVNPRIAIREFNR